MNQNNQFIKNNHCDRYISNMEIPKESLNHLLCDDCDGYLSSAPVFSKEDGVFICGKCDATGKNLPRMLPYEELAKLMLFPCKFRQYGCSHKLSFSDETNHEDICQFREVCCPFIDWRGPHTNLMEHCSTTHQKKILRDGSEQEIYSETVENFLIAEFDRIFSVRIKLSKSAQTIFHSISSIGVNATEYTYNLINKTKNLAVKTDDNSNFNFNSIQRNLNEYDLTLKLNEVTGNKSVQIFFYYENPRYSKKFEENKLPCENNTKGCNFIDIESKVDKHRLHHCQYSPWCEICEDNFKEYTRDEHRSERHTDIITKSGIEWDTVLCARRQWRIISSDVGFLLCSYQLVADALEIRVMSSLTRRELRRYSSVFTIPSLNIRENFDLQIDDYVDWHTQIDKDLIRNCIDKNICFKIDIFETTDTSNQ